jgi:hypothetical protein
MSGGESEVAATLPRPRVTAAVGRWSALGADPPQRPRQTESVAGSQFNVCHQMPAGKLPVLCCDTAQQTPRSLQRMFSCMSAFWFSRDKLHPEIKANSRRAIQYPNALVIVARDVSVRFAETVILCWKGIQPFTKHGDQAAVLSYSWARRAHQAAT